MTVIAMFLKLFSECALLLSVLAAFPQVFPHSFSLLLPALVCGFAAGLAALLSEKHLTVVSRLCAVLPLAVLLFAGETMEALTLLPAMVYTVAVILRGRMELEYYSYRQFFRRTLILAGILYLSLSAFAFLEQTFTVGTLPVYGAGYFQTGIILRYGLLYLLCGVVLQRQLRLGTEARSAGGAGQLVATLGLTGVALVAFVGAVDPLRKGAAALFHLIVTAVFGTVMAGVEAVSTVVNSIDLGLMMKEKVIAAEDRLPAQGSNVLQEAIQQTLENQEAEPSLWWVVPVAIVLLALMIFMLLSLRKKGIDASSEEITGTVTAPTPEKKLPRRSNRAKVRQLYREFLRQERKRGLSFKKDYTSQDILHRISDDTDGTAAAELRELYIRARYDETHEVSQAQVEAAKAALKRSRGCTNASAR